MMFINVSFNIILLWRDQDTDIGNSITIIGVPEDSIVMCMHLARDYKTCDFLKTYKNYSNMT